MFKGAHIEFNREVKVLRANLYLRVKDMKLIVYCIG